MMAGERETIYSDRQYAAVTAVGMALGAVIMIIVDAFSHRPLSILEAVMVVVLWGCIPGVMLGIKDAIIRKGAPEA